MSERHHPYPALPEFSDEERVARAKAGFDRLKTRRSGRLLDRFNQ